MFLHLALLQVFEAGITLFFSDDETEAWRLRLLNVKKLEHRTTGI